MAGKLKKLSQAQADECVSLYQHGLSVGAVALQFGVSRQAMWDLLRRRTEMRPRARNGADNHFFRGGARAYGPSQNKLEKAVANGTVSRATECEECGGGGTFADGRSSIQAHHDDYNKPLEVRWLCQRCHHEWHRNNVAIQKRGAA